NRHLRWHGKPRGGPIAGARGGGRCAIHATTDARSLARHAGAVARIVDGAPTSAIAAAGHQGTARTPTWRRSRHSAKSISIASAPFLTDQHENSRFMDEAYDPRYIQQRHYQRWETNGWFAPSGEGQPYAVMLPPPNVTGTLHMGHAF